jgi:hypothetical protein
MYKREREQERTLIKTHGKTQQSFTDQCGSLSLTCYGSCILTWVDLLLLVLKFETLPHMSPRAWAVSIIYKEFYFSQIELATWKSNGADIIILQV